MDKEKIMEKLIDINNAANVIVVTKNLIESTALGIAAGVSMLSAVIAVVITLVCNTLGYTTVSCITCVAIIAIDIYLLYICKSLTKKFIICTELYLNKSVKTIDGFDELTDKEKEEMILSIFNK